MQPVGARREREGVDRYAFAAGRGRTGRPSKFFAKRDAPDAALPVR